MVIVDRDPGDEHDPEHRYKHAIMMVDRYLRETLSGQWRAPIFDGESRVTFIMYTFHVAYGEPRLLFGHDDG